MSSVKFAAFLSEGNMSIRSSLATVLLMTVLFPAANVASGADLPTYDEILAAYRQNLAALLPLSVEWNYVEQELSAAIETDLVHSNLTKASLERKDYPSDDKAFVQGLEKKFDRALSPEAREARLSSRRSRHFLWTDGRDLQYRTPEKGKEVELDGPEATSGDSLLKNWLSVRVSSFDPGRDPKLRVWLGYGSDGKTPFGMIATKELGQMHGRFRFPPLGVTRAEWGDRNRFSILDMWTDDKLIDAVQSTEAGESIRGEETLLVRYAHGGQPGTSVGRMAIWVAHRKGFIPLRIERSYSGGSPTLEPTAEYPSRIYETLEIEGVQAAGTGFYPTKVTRTHYGPDPKWRSENLGKDPTVVPTVPVQMVPLGTVQEEFKVVQAGRSLSDESLSLKYPVGTRFQDQDTKEWYLEGTPKDEFDRQLVAELKTEDSVPRTRSTSSTQQSHRAFLLWTNVAVVVVLAIIFLRFRSKAQS